MKFFSCQPNYDQKFPHLGNAPIVEAVIEFQVVSIETWNHVALRDQLKSRLLPDYPNLQEGHQMQFILGLPRPAQDLGCIGIRALSSDGYYIAQFNQSGFVLSRVKKYDRWETFCQETNRLWDIYRELLKPTAIKRIGVRFINRMSADYPKRDFLKFFRDAPKRKQVCNWDLENFLHRDVLHIPNTDYRVNLVKTVVSSPEKGNEVAAVLDCDVFYDKQLSCEWIDISKHLKAMRWAKNTVFYKNITRKTIMVYDK